MPDPFLSWSFSGFVSISTILVKVSMVEVTKGFTCSTLTAMLGMESFLAWGGMQCPPGVEHNPWRAG